MGERRFHFQEILKTGVGWESSSTITESELSKRIILLFDYMANGGFDITRQIEILLHGEQKEK